MTTTTLKLRNNLKPRNRKYLITRMIDFAMSGNEGQAVLQVRNSETTEGLAKLNSLYNKLIDIKVKARQEMRLIIEKYVNDNL